MTPDQRPLSVEVSEPFLMWQKLSLGWEQAAPESDAADCEPEVVDARLTPNL